MAATTDGARPSATSQEGTFTDLVFTIPGRHGLDDERVWSMAEEFHQRLEAEFGGEVGLASHGCNEDFETWHSLVAEVKWLRTAIANAHAFLDAEDASSRASGRSVWTVETSLVRAALGPAVGE